MPHNLMAHVDNGEPERTERFTHRCASMQPCMNSSTGHKPRLPDINIGSVVTTQVTDLSGKAAVKMQPLISPSSSPRRCAAVCLVAGWPLDVWIMRRRTSLLGTGIKTQKSGDTVRCALTRPTRHMRCRWHRAKARPPQEEGQIVGHTVTHVPAPPTPLRCGEEQPPGDSATNCTPSAPSAPSTGSTRSYATSSNSTLKHDYVLNSAR